MDSYCFRRMGRGRYWRGKCVFCKKCEIVFGLTWGKVFSVFNISASLIGIRGNMQLVFTGGDSFYRKSLLAGSFDRHLHDDADKIR